MKEEIIYFDENNKITDLEHAKTAVIRLTDEKGNLIRETFGYIGGGKTEEGKEEEQNVVIKK